MVSSNHVGIQKGKNKKNRNAERKKCMKRGSFCKKSDQLQFFNAAGSGSPGLVLRRNWRIPRWLARRWGVQYLQPKWPLFFEGQRVPQNKAEFPIKTRVIWVLGIDTCI